MAVTAAESQSSPSTLRALWRGVAAVLADPLSMSQWASCFGHSLLQEKAGWLTDDPEAPVGIRFSPPNAFGIANHWVEVMPGLEVYVP